MNLFVCGLRRSGTTILYDALVEDPELRCFYEPLREDTETIGGGSGARDGDALRRDPRAARGASGAEHYPELPDRALQLGRPAGAGARARARACPSTSAGCSPTCSSQAPDVAIKETRLHHKLGALAELDPDAAVVHLVRDPRAVTASMLLGRRRRTDIYPDADDLLHRPHRAAPVVEPADLRGARRPAALARASRPTSPTSSARCSSGRRPSRRPTATAPRLFGDRYALRPARGPARRPARRARADLRAHRARRSRTGWPSGPPTNVRRDAEIHLRRRPALGAGGAAARDGAGARGAPATARSSSSSRRPGEPLDLTPPAARSRLAGFMGRRPAPRTLARAPPG